MLGLRKGGMESVGKHFPGHGTVTADSHFECPVDHRHENDLQLADMVPFQRLIDHGIAGIMSAHVVYEYVDKKPASFSPYWLTRVLREQMRFEGVIRLGFFDYDEAYNISIKRGEIIKELFGENSIEYLQVVSTQYELKLNQRDHKKGLKILEKIKEK